MSNHAAAGHAVGGRRPRSARSAAKISRAEADTVADIETFPWRRYEDRTRAGDLTATSASAPANSRKEKGDSGFKEFRLSRRPALAAQRRP